MKTTTNKTIELVNDFQWVIKVLYSSTTKEHLITCDKLFFKVFLNKWSFVNGEAKKKMSQTFNYHRYMVKHNKIMKYGR